jgi:hypothetical protein
VPSESDTTRDPVVLRVCGVDSESVTVPQKHTKWIHTSLVPSDLTSRETGTKHEKAPRAGSRRDAVVSTFEVVGRMRKDRRDSLDESVRNLLELPLK